MAKKKKRKLTPKQKLMQRAIKFRIYPDTEQETLIGKTVGCCRFIWNKMLEDEETFYVATDKCYIPTPAKYKKEFPFLKEADSLALANTQIALQNSFKGFFDKRTNYPNFKSKKKSRKSYTTNCQYPKNGKPSIRFIKGGIHLPILGDVEAKIYRFPKKGWKLKSATISQSKSGKYYCSLLFEFVFAVPDTVIPTLDSTIGLDYSSPSFYVDDKGNSPEKKRWFREMEDKLAKLQRQLSHMEYGSSNYKKQLKKIQLCHEKIANQRKDFAHKESRRIANAFNLVCVEDLNLATLAKSLKLGKSTLDNGFGMFRTFLEYKLNEQGKDLIKIDKWFPSSKTCSFCGHIYKELTLSDRFWVCPICGEFLLRDDNAAINIKREGYHLFFETFNSLIAA